MVPFLRWRLACAPWVLFPRPRRPACSGFTVPSRPPRGHAESLFAARLVPTPFVLIAVGALVVALEIHVRMVEEPYLMRTHGDTCRDYAARVGLFVPRVARLASAHDFVPALGADWATPLYNLVAR